MKFREIAALSGVGTYPAVLDDIYLSMSDTDKDACDLELIDHLQETYGVFGEFYETVRDTAVAVNCDEARSMWVKVAVAYAKDKGVADARRIPVPKADGTQVTALLPLYILIPQIPDGLEKYRKKGFSEQEIEKLAKAYLSGLRIVNSQVGMPCVNALYYHWLTLFVKASIFNTDGLQFELRPLPSTTAYLKNITTGQILPMMCKGLFHRSGRQPIGSAGYTDDREGFETVFYEDENNYYGHGVVDCIVDANIKAYPKTQWHCVARPGDDCMSIHIPRGADISKETLYRAIDSAYRIESERYPEHKSVGIYGSSWILDPKLGELLGPDSKITVLLEQFSKYPEKSDGHGLFGYVFPKNFQSYETLPENTGLQRKVKKIYLDGGYIYNYAGLILK